MIEINSNIEGTILDIGGGGDGIISSIYGKNVVAIDLSEDELNEMDSAFLCKKNVMDASNLKFSDALFDNVTAFYSFMFIDKTKHQLVLSETYRVLKTNGLFYIWDTYIPDTDDVVMVELKVNAAGRIFTPTYGIRKDNPFQNAEYMKDLCEKAGFKLVSENEEDLHFHQVFQKV